MKRYRMSKVSLDEFPNSEIQDDLVTFYNSKEQVVQLRVIAIDLVTGEALVYKTKENGSLYIDPVTNDLVIIRTVVEHPLVMLICKSN